MILKLLEAMGRCRTKVVEFKNGFYGPYDRANEEQKAKYDPILDSINNDFKKNWPSMTDEEKMRWKYQRYMQDYLGVYFFSR